MKVRIKDIALRAGVSTGTVDRVLHRRGRVSDRTRKRVHNAMEELQYKPDIVARTLAKNEKKQLKILIPYPYQDFYWKMIRDGIVHGLEEFAPYRLSGQTHFYDMNDPHHFQHLATEILESGPEVILIGSEFQRQTIDLLKECNRQGIACIVMNAEINSVPSLSYIGINSFVVGELVGKIIRSTRDRSSVLVVHTTENITNTIHLKNKELGLVHALEKSKLPILIQSVVFNNQANRETDLNHLIDKIDQTGADTIYITTSKAYMFASALKGQFPDLYIIGHDLIDQNISLLQNGLIDLLIDQSGYKMGYLGVKSWVDHHILEKNIPSKQYLPLAIVYPENLPFYLNKQGSEYALPLK